ncbi:TetR/AcrR family transcriptional regulator [Novosphingopyxis sp.]|uniref:TetR/AcrR family transcriptional regulator n=1 Tax=Novosphingopyxis sp. TaxID=2709690 RepID=UPI003B599E7B
MNVESNAAKGADQEERTGRFEAKRERIVSAAAELINERGVKGMTFVDVGRMVDLNTTSIAYYFKRKDRLAEAVFHRTLERIEREVDEAGTEPTPQARVRRYLELSFERIAAQREGTHPPEAQLSDIRAMPEDTRERLLGEFVRMFRKVRRFFGETDDPVGHADLTARAHIFLEFTYWLPVLLSDYSRTDFGRLHERSFELMRLGLAAGGRQAEALDLPVPARVESDGPERGLGDFLEAATRLINERGYRGASVERIASQLNVTKGSFYHHLAAKDDLVMKCFAASYDRVSAVQRLALAEEGSFLDRIASSVFSLVHAQFDGDRPLLRTTAMGVLPPRMQQLVLERSDWMARRFAGMMIDGIAQGSVRAIDPLVASQLAMVMLNAAWDLRGWAGRRDMALATRLYTAPLLHGFFGPPAGS